MTEKPERPRGLSGMGAALTDAEIAARRKSYKIQRGYGAPPLTEDDFEARAAAEAEIRRLRAEVMHQKGIVRRINSPDLSALCRKCGGPEHYMNLCPHDTIAELRAQLAARDAALEAIVEAAEQGATIETEPLVKAIRRAIVEHVSANPPSSAAEPPPPAQTESR